MGRLLYLVHRIPYPPNKGDKIRSFNVLKALAKDHDVVLGCFVDDPADLEHVDVLHQYCQDVFVRSIDPKRRKVAALHGLLTGEALSIAFYRDAAFQRWVTNQIDGGVDAAILFSAAMARFVPQESFETLPIWMDFVDLDSDKWQQYAEAQNGLMRRVYEREAARLLDFERTIAGNAHMSSFVTDDEVALFKDRSGLESNRVTAVHNGVDLEYFTPRDAALSSHQIVFTGAMDYQANVDAVTWFVSEVFGLIRAAQPAARFTIVGSKPTPSVKALSQVEGVDVTGFVEDIRDNIAGASVCVAPMRIARGVQNKVLEAMAMGKPVVATQAGYEGIRAVPGQDLLVESDAEAFAQAVLSLMTSPGKAHEMGRSARHAMERGYAWQAALGPLTDFARALG